MSVPYDYDPSNIEHLRAVIAEQEAAIGYLHERCKAEEVENTKLRELCASLYEFAMSEYPDGTELNFADRIRELGVEL